MRPDSAPDSEFTGYAAGLGAGQYNFNDSYHFSIVGPNSN